MEASEINQIIELLKPSIAPLSGAISAVAGAVATAFASIIPNRAMARASREEKVTSTTLQIYAEIQSIIEVERHRKYSEHLRNIIDDLKSGAISVWAFRVEMPDDRFYIYKANLPNLGLLPPKLQVDIVQFYQLTESIIQDIKPGGLLNEPGAGIEQYEEVLQMLQKAKAIGTDILEEIKRVHRIE